MLDSSLLRIEISTTLHLKPCFRNLVETLSARAVKMIQTSRSVSRSLGVVVLFPIDFTGTLKSSRHTGSESYPFANVHNTNPIFPKILSGSTLSVSASSPIVWIPSFCNFLFVCLPTYNRSDAGSPHTTFL